MNLNTLEQLDVGRKAIVRKVKNEGSIRRRLLDIGLIEGTEVESAFRSPGGDPTAYFIRGTLIAIRGEDAHQIEID